MRTAQRRAQEVASRERLLVEVALRMVEQDGFHNLTLGRLAEESAYSKGTVYNHFMSREDLLIELSIESAHRQLRYYNAVNELPWQSEWLLYALALAYMRHAEISPVLFECSITARTNSVCALASEIRMQRRDVLESQLMQLVGSVMNRVVAEGKYVNSRLPPGVALDVVRSHILGYALMHLLSSRFLWAGKPEDETRLSALASVFRGLGWPELALGDLRQIQQTVAELVAKIEAEYGHQR